MKALSLSVLAGVVATPAIACDLCSIYSATEARGEIGKGFHLSLAEQFTHYGTLQSDGVKVDNPLSQYLDSSISQVVVGYNFNERFGLQLNVPLVHRSFLRADDAGDAQRGSESGLGDLSLSANVVAYRRETKHFTFNWSVLGGLKFPTGNTRRLEEELNEPAAPPPIESGIHGHDLTLGTGSFDGIVGTGVYTRWNRFFMTANLQYAIRTKGDFDYDFANDLTWSGGPGVLLALKDKYTFALQAIVSGENKGRDTFQGVTADDTGVTSVFVGPQFSVTWSERFSVEAGVEFPVSIENTALQSVPDWRVRAGLTWRF